MTQFPSEIEFVSYLKYSPRGESETSRKSRTATYAVKNDGLLGAVRAIDLIVEKLASRVGEYPVLAECFVPTGVLVPMPRSGPLLAGGLWPTRRICECLVKVGLGTEVLGCVERVRAVRKSSTAGPGERPGPEAHFESVEINHLPMLSQPKRIILVDDVVTRGATFVGIARKVREYFPAAEVVCFALVRTISSGEIDAIRDPVKGIITYRSGRIERAP